MENQEGMEMLQQLMELVKRKNVFAGIERK